MKLYTKKNLYRPATRLLVAIRHLYFLCDSIMSNKLSSYFSTFYSLLRICPFFIYIYFVQCFLAQTTSMSLALTFSMRTVLLCCFPLHVLWSLPDRTSCLYIVILELKRKKTGQPNCKH
ncbi:MAG: hypothetical protein J3R72DRAFT_454659 [Linnemannia gamsii]|nr:MAG: hypothetical protein J3R72DRAFT_454659 [Linnemannia gamsii]